MSTAVPISAPSIPMPTGEIQGNSMAINAMKQNIEITQGTRGVVRAANLHGPTVVNIATDAALRKVQGTYP